MGSQPIILIPATLAWLAGFLILSRLKVRAQGPSPTPPRASLSIVIPARDEAHNLPVLLASINAQTLRPLEVIVVDDASTDRTAQIALQSGATVISSLALPDGWRGKTWALQQGANAAKGDLLLFIDADTWFEPDGLRQILSQYEGGALSVGPYHAARKPYEQLSAFFNVVMAAGTLPHGLFGQMLLVERQSYQLIGGHKSVKDRVLENVFLAQRFRQAAIPTRSLPGKGLLAFRMYPNGIRQLIEGWTKGFASGAARTPKPTLLLIAVWLTGIMLPIGSLPFSPWAALLYLLFAIQLIFIFRRVGAFHWYTALFYPIPLVFYFIIFGCSALRPGKRVTWKGRSFHAD